MNTSNTHINHKLLHVIQWVWLRRPIFEHLLGREQEEEICQALVDVFLNERGFYPTNKNPTIFLPFFYKIEHFCYGRTSLEDFYQEMEEEIIHYYQFYDKGKPLHSVERLLDVLFLLQKDYSHLKQGLGSDFFNHTIIPVSDIINEKLGFIPTSDPFSQSINEEIYQQILAFTFEEITKQECMEQIIALVQKSKTR